MVIHFDVRDLRLSTRWVAGLAFATLGFWLVFVTIPWLRTPTWIYFTRPYFTLAAFFMPLWLGAMGWAAIHHDRTHPHWKMVRWNLLGLLAILLPLYACWAVARQHEREREAKQAADPLVKEIVGRHPLNSVTCRPVQPEVLDRLSESWKPFKDYVLVCPVSMPGRKPVLYVVTIDVASLEQSLDPKAPALNYPPAELWTPEGKQVGQLPYAFPFDPPVTSELYFWRWNQGFPEKVRIWLHDPAVVGDRRLPDLDWNADLQKFAISSQTSANTN